VSEHSTTSWQVALATDSYRAASEDRAGVWPTRYGYLLAVADGMGGRAGGAAAAEFAINEIGRFSRWPVFPSVKTLSDLLRQIDLDGASQTNIGETALLVCAVSQKGISGAAAGDCAAWWVTADAVTSLADGAFPKPWVGSGAAKPFPFTLPADCGKLLLITDGVWKYTDPKRLVDTARSTELSSMAASLINAARLGNGKLQDDAAVVVAISQLAHK
jgi:serine/threonine protein phosphatase PrpC